MLQAPLEAMSVRADDEYTRSLLRNTDFAATEKLNAQDEQPKRRGGGVSAADLLRREGRL